MKRLSVSIVLILVLLMSASPLYALDEKEKTTEEATVSKPQDMTFSVEDMTSGAGLLMVGGAGAGITIFNKSRRKENEPIREIKGDKKKTKTED